jgi:hypothetical protein
LTGRPQPLFILLYNTQGYSLLPWRSTDSGQFIIFNMQDLFRLFCQKSEQLAVEGGAGPWALVLPPPNVSQSLRSHTVFTVSGGLLRSYWAPAVDAVVQNPDSTIFLPKK